LEVIGSQQFVALGALLQQLLCPAVTRRAAWPYFSRTTSLTSLGADMDGSLR
jgi:hypothetical protein